ncbi:hypothetical protein FACS1894130_13200 [Spirochaetia bacterium]|nr:hypothetical protein FACS1894130_13200 [Spirochaetia bacterium]
MKKCMSVIIILFFSLSCIFAEVIPDTEIKNVEMRYKDGKGTYYTKDIDKFDFDKIITICNESKYDNSGIMAKVPTPNYYIRHSEIPSAIERIPLLVF